jgi:hypothetical protein
MVFVPGGFFLMGRESSDSRQDDFPLRVIYVSPFLIDKCEVTNAEYRKFVEHVKKTGDSTMEHPDAPPLKEHGAEGWKHQNLAGDRQPVMARRTVPFFQRSDAPVRAPATNATAMMTGKRMPLAAARRTAHETANTMDLVFVLGQFNAIAVNADFTAAGGVRQPIVRLNSIENAPGNQNVLVVTYTDTNQGGAVVRVARVVPPMARFCP